MQSLMSRHGRQLFAVALLFAPCALWCQSSSSEAGANPNSSNAVPQAVNQKRVLGIIPNYRTSTFPRPYKPISPKEKFKLASQDAFDRGTFVLAAAFAGESQLSNSNPSFDKGAAGYGEYFASAYADFAVGDYMTEAIFPTLLHQDPRYFRRGQGGVKSRLAYAAGQIILTHGDNGRVQFKYSELAGNATSVAISNAYYVDNRDASDATVKWVSQLGVDAASNILKEFWPDILAKITRKH